MPDQYSPTLAAGARPFVPARNAEGVFLESEDNSKGMSRERLSEVQSQGSGVGIRGMLKRIRQFGGKMNVESGQFRDRVSATLPLSECDAVAASPPAVTLETR